MVSEEEHLKAEARGDMSEAELLILDEFTTLARDLYAFYPLLIRFVDYNRYSVLCFILALLGSPGLTESLHSLPNMVMSLLMIIKPMFMAKLMFTEQLDVVIRNRILKQSALCM